MKCYKKINKLKPEVGYYVMRLETVNLQYSKFSSLKMFAKSSAYLYKTLVLYAELTTSISSLGQHRMNSILSHKVQWSIETTLPVHVLAVLALQNDVNCAYFISRYFLSLCSIKSTETHKLHHFLFIRTLPF